MATYQQKLQVITALQYDGSNAQDVISFGNGKITSVDGKLMLSHYEGSFPTEIQATDWVTKGPTMVVSSMSNTLFSASFEPNA